MFKCLVVLVCGSPPKAAPNPKDAWDKCTYCGDPIEPHDVKWELDVGSFHRSRGCSQKHFSALMRDIY